VRDAIIGIRRAEHDVASQRRNVTARATKASTELCWLSTSFAVVSGRLLGARLARRKLGAARAARATLVLPKPNLLLADVEVDRNRLLAVTCCGASSAVGKVRRHSARASRSSGWVLLVLILLRVLMLELDVMRL